MGKVIQTDAGCHVTSLAEIITSCRSYGRSKRNKEATPPGSSSGDQLCNDSCLINDILFCELYYHIRKDDDESVEERLCVFTLALSLFLSVDLVGLNFFLRFWSLHLHSGQWDWNLSSTGLQQRSSRAGPVQDQGRPPVFLLPRSGRSASTYTGPGTHVPGRELRVSQAARSPSPVQFCTGKPNL